MANDSLRDIVKKLSDNELVERWNELIDKQDFIENPRYDLEYAYIEAEVQRRGIDVYA